MMSDENGQNDARLSAVQPSRTGSHRLIQRLRAGVPILFPPPPPADLPEPLRFLLSMRRHRLRRFLIRMGFFVLLPSLLVLFYTLVIETPRYVCNFEITYQVYQPTTTVSGGLVPATPSSADAIDYGTVITQYVQSGALAEHLDAQLKLRDYYSRSSIDWTSRLGPHANSTAFLNYYGRMVSISEGFGGYLTISVEGFDPQFTLLLAQTIDADTNTMLDGLTAQARAEQVKAATDQVTLTASQLADANATMTTFRNTHGDLDPDQIATELGAIEGTLETQLAGVKAQLAQAQANLQSNSSQIVQLNLQAAAIQHEINSERARLAAAGGSSLNYAGTVSDYQTLLAAQQAALTNYQTAQQGLMAAKADAAREQYYVVDFVAPSLPDRPTAPNPLLSAAETMLACIIGYAIVNLLFSALRDQTGV